MFLLLVFGCRRRHFQLLLTLPRDLAERSQREGQARAAHDCGDFQKSRQKAPRRGAKPSKMSSRSTRGQHFETSSEKRSTTGRVKLKRYYLNLHALLRCFQADPSSAFGFRWRIFLYSVSVYMIRN